MTDKLDRELEKEIVKNIIDEPVEGGTVNEPVEGGIVREPLVPYSNFVKKVKKENITPENIGEIVLSQIPGISAITATAIMKKFSTFPKLLASLQENPQCMDDIMLETAGKSRKISKSSVENIKKFFSQ